VAVIDLVSVDDGGSDDLSRAAGGDPFDQLYRRYAADLRRFCRRRLGNDAEADDACHEAMLRAHRALPAFRSGARVWPWLATIAANVCTDMLRARRCTSLETHGEDRSDATDLHDEVMGRLRRQLVDEALDGLPDRYRRPIHLFDLEGWSYEQIAELDGSSVGAVRGNLHRGRQALRERVQQVARQRGIWPLPAIIPLRWRDKVAALRASRDAEVLAPMTSSGMSLAQMAAAAVAVLTTMAPVMAAAASGGEADDPAAAVTTPAASAPVATEHEDVAVPRPSVDGDGRSAPAPAPDPAVPVPVPEVATASTEVQVDGGHRSARGEIVWGPDGDSLSEERTFLGADSDCGAEIWLGHCEAATAQVNEALGSP
jgi:RNA polymerase sigma-70 factor, ECF subfamily